MVDSRHPVGMASYPKKFSGTVISPHKICLQWTDVSIKLRTLGNDLKMLPKDPLRHTPILKVSTDPIDIQVVAVACEMPVLKDLLHTVISSYSTYAITHTETYKKLFGSDLKADLKSIHQKLGEVIENL